MGRPVHGGVHGRSGIQGGHQGEEAPRAAVPWATGSAWLPPGVASCAASAVDACAGNSTVPWDAAAWECRRISDMKGKGGGGEEVGAGWELCWFLGRQGRSSDAPPYAFAILPAVPCLLGGALCIRRPQRLCGGRDDTTRGESGLSQRPPCYSQYAFRSTCIILDTSYVNLVAPPIDFSQAFGAPVHFAYFSTRCRQPNLSCFCMVCAKVWSMVVILAICFS